VEEQGGVRLDEAPQTKFIACLKCGDVAPEKRFDSWRSTWRRAWFEGEYPLFVWPRSVPPQVPRLGYAPSEFQTKRWPYEALIEGWFPPLAREHERFIVVKDANHVSRRVVERPSSAVASGFDADRGREANREPGRSPSNGYLNPSQPLRLPEPPRHTCRLEADAYVARNADRRRRAEVCLDNSFHRRPSKRDPKIKHLVATVPSYSDAVRAS